MNSMHPHEEPEENPAEPQGSEPVEGSDPEEVEQDAGTGDEQEDVEKTTPAAGKASQVTPLLRRQVEAILFASEQPVSPRSIAGVLKVQEGLVRAAIRDLAADYDQQNRAFGVTEIAGGYQVLSRPEYGNLVARLYEQSRQTRLSQPALETLAIVAYKQPVMRVQIEDIRGVGVQEVLGHLLDMGLLRVVGRADALGRPLLYGTTKKFLITFGLKSPKDLPSVEDLKTVD